VIIQDQRPKLVIGHAVNGNIDDQLGYLRKRVV
jgi:hypothetical protein